ncbi:NADP-dependent oxidoreductase [Streptacidiphilus cavernicola]|uniref:NADP-dependent oxidoreductase n=1 Tax=Streptacidiphilus cavernicola TaxID=3342716 RepID=A0ABV6VUX8_9ACTN
MSVPSHAKSVAFSGYGDADVLRLTESPVPEPGPGQVLLRVRAVGVNPLDWKVRRGFMEAVFPVAFPHVPGLEASGVVAAVGADVTAWKPGDEVLGPVAGGYAEYALADAAKLAAKPADLGWEAAAALPVAAESATRALGALGLVPGETLLVHAAAGSVGSLTVQLAVAAGVTVVGTASEANHDHLRALGAIPVRYGEGQFDRIRAAAPQGVDAVLDAAGSGVLAESVALAGGPERVVSLVDPAEAGPLGVRFSGGGPGEDRTVEGLAGALALHRAETLALPVRAALPLADAASAHRLSEQGHGLGKIVLLP